MKFKRLTAALIAVTMTVGMIPTLVFADDAQTEPAETSAVQTTESKETKESKETEKETAESKESETTETEAKKPEQTESVESSGFKETEPSESDEKETKASAEPSETETKAPETSESQAPAETETTVPEVKPDKGPAVTAKNKAKNDSLKEDPIHKDQTNTFYKQTKIARPIIPSSADSPWSGSYVYFGRCTIDGNWPMKFRVLSPSISVYGKPSMFLDSEYTLFDKEFDSNSYNWDGSSLQYFLNGAFLSSSFTSTERNSIITSYGTGDLTYKSPSYEATIFGSPVKVNDKIFLLDVSEAMNSYYGYSSDSSWTTSSDWKKVHSSDWTQHKVLNRSKSGCFWWLRSAGTTADGLACVGQVDADGMIDGITNHRAWGVAPALNVDLDSILLSTVVSGTANKVGAEYKLTLKDPDLSISVQSGKKASISGRTVTIPYQISGSHAGNVNRVSVIVRRNTTLDFLYYDALSGTVAENGTGTFTLPDGLDLNDWGTKYYVYILAEQTFGSQTTDYASDMVALDAPVAAGPTKYNVHIDVVYPGGIDTSEISGIVTVDKEQAASGEKITVTATPNSGYVLYRIEWCDGTQGKSVDITSTKTFTVGNNDPYIYVMFWNEPKPNTLFSVNPKTAKIKYKKLKKKAQTVSNSKVMTVSNAQGALNYSLVSVKRGKSKKYKKYFKINAKTGNVTVKKKLKKGTYKITCKVTAAGNADYLSAIKTVTFKIKVK